MTRGHSKLTYTGKVALLFESLNFSFSSRFPPAFDASFSKKKGHNLIIINVVAERTEFNLSSCGENMSEKNEQKNASPNKMKFVKQILTKLPFDLIAKRNNSIILSITSRGRLRSHAERFLYQIMPSWSPTSFDEANNENLTSNYAMLAEKSVKLKLSRCRCKWRSHAALSAWIIFVISVDSMETITKSEGVAFSRNSTLPIHFLA